VGDFGVSLRNDFKTYCRKYKEENPLKVMIEDDMGVRYAHCHVDLQYQIASMYYLWQKIWMKIIDSSNFEPIIAGKFGCIPSMGIEMSKISPCRITHVGLKCLKSENVYNILMNFIQRKDLKDLNMKSLLETFFYHQMIKKGITEEDMGKYLNEEYWLFNEFLFENTGGHPRILQYTLLALVELLSSKDFNFDISYYDLQLKIFQKLGSKNILAYQSLKIFQKHDEKNLILDIISSLNNKVIDLNNDTIKLLNIRNQFELEDIIIYLGFNYEKINDSGSLKISLPVFTYMNMLQEMKINYENLYDSNFINNLINNELIINNQQMHPSKVMELHLFYKLAILLSENKDCEFLNLCTNIEGDVEIVEFKSILLNIKKSTEKSQTFEDFINQWKLNSKDKIPKNAYVYYPESDYSEFFDIIILLPPPPSPSDINNKKYSFVGIQCKAFFDTKLGKTAFEEHVSKYENSELKLIESNFEKLYFYFVCSNYSNEVKKSFACASCNHENYDRNEHKHYYSYRKRAEYEFFAICETVSKELGNMYKNYNQPKQSKAITMKNLEFVLKVRKTLEIKNKD
jgi:hypothetical protein